MNMAESSQPEEENAIAYLNSYAGKHGKTQPEYKEKDTRGEPHKRTFTLTCQFVDLEVCCEGKSKKEAKRACAVSMVKKMREAGLLSPAESMEYEPVAVLQQLLQKKGYPLPRYDEVGAGGLPHCKIFSIKATALYPDYKEISDPAIATASSKKEAKKKAASELLDRVRPLLDTSPVVSCIVHCTQHVCVSICLCVVTNCVCCALTIIFHCTALIDFVTISVDVYTSRNRNLQLYSLLSGSSTNLFTVMHANELHYGISYSAVQRPGISTAVHLLS